MAKKMKEPERRGFRLAKHPDTGEVAPKGLGWARNLMSGRYILEDLRISYTRSVQSETYWSS